MKSLIEKLKKSKLATPALALFILAALVFSYFQLHSVFGQSEAARIGSSRLFICSETKKPFEVPLTSLDKIPTHSPYSGKDTGYPAELCYWTKDGSPKNDPTPVLLNSYIGVSGPTFCPDCGRLVVGHNPVPTTGATPPPTHEEYLARHGVAAR